MERWRNLETKDLVHIRLDHKTVLFETKYLNTTHLCLCLQLGRTMPASQYGWKPLDVWRQLLLSWLFHVNKSFDVTQTLKILLPSVIENVEQILCGFPKLCVIRAIYQYNKLNVYILYSGEGNGNPLQCSFLQNRMDKEAWRAKIHGVAKGLTWLSDTHTHTL